jgi:hypothetical protein
VPMGVSLVMLKHTIHAKLVLDRKSKREAVEHEYKVRLEQVVRDPRMNFGGLCSPVFYRQ